MALKRMSLNSATDVPVHSVLNRYHDVIGPTSMIERIISQYIVRRVTISERVLFLIQ